ISDEGKGPGTNVRPSKENADSARQDGKPASKLSSRANPFPDGNPTNSSSRSMKSDVLARDGSPISTWCLMCSRTESYSVDANGTLRTSWTGVLFEVIWNLVE